jgi:magnesium transporter
MRMIKMYRSTKLGLEATEELTNGCWIDVSAPSADEIAHLQGMLGVPQDFITYPLDLGEMPRTQKEDGATLIVLRVPYFQGEAADIPYITVPVGIILSNGYIATVSKIDTEVIREIASGRPRGFYTDRPSRFVLQLLFVTANKYLSQLREINKTIDQTEDRLQLSLRNKEVLQLLKCQKSLLYFTTALTSNELMMRRLQKERLFHQNEEDEDLLNDVLTEVDQAIQMTNISHNILSQMMDAFASIISNNLNVVMKFLASVTIILSLPTLIATMYGMNVRLPFQGSPWAFLIVLGLSLVVSVPVTIIFWKRDWM